MLIVRAPSHTDSHVGQGPELSRLSGNHTNGRKTSVCVSFTSALASVESSPPNAETTSSCKCLFNANPQTS